MVAFACLEAYEVLFWYTFDATQSDYPVVRIAIAYGQDAADVALATQFGLLTLTEMNVWVRQVNSQIATHRRIHHNKFLLFQSN